MKNQMLHHLKKLKAFCLDNKIFTAFLLVQAVVLAAMLLSAFSPKVVYTVPLDSFVENGHSDAIAITEEGLMVANSIWITDTEMLQSQPFALAKGAYKVYVSYQSVYDVTSINDVAGDINLYSLALYHQNTKTQSRVIEKNLVLLFRESSQTAEGRIWVDGQEG